MKENEIDFDSIDFVINTPVVSEQKTLLVTSNADNLKGKIEKIVARYKGVQLTDANVDYVKTLKSNFVSLRTGIERERKEWSKVYIDPTKKTVDAVCKELQSIVAEGESALTVQLEQYDQKRIDALTEVLNNVKDRLIEENALTDKFANFVILKDKYFNKTQSEDDSITDLEEQVKEAKKKQTDEESAIKMIELECKDSTLVSATYVRMLEFKSAMEILLLIKQDKQANLELLKQRENKAPVEPVVTEPVEPVVTESGMKIRKIELTYPQDRTEIVAKLFKDLCSYGISYKFIKE